MLLEDMLTAMSRFDCARALEILKHAVVEYAPAVSVHDLVWQRQSEFLAEQRKVTDLKLRRIIRPTGSTESLR